MPAREALAGRHTSWTTWSPFLSERFRHGECWFIPAGDVDWDTSDGARWNPVDDGERAPHEWHARDELFAAMRSLDGRLLGIISVGEPATGRRPDDEELLLLSALAAHVARAVEAAGEAAEAAHTRAALQHLLGVAAQLAEGGSSEGVLDAVCRGVHEALGFDRVACELVGPDGRLVPAAEWPRGIAAASGLTIDDVRALADPEFETAGCYLLRREDALARIPRDTPPWPTRNPGRGPLAWIDHWLLVPLQDRDGQLAGVLWADHPQDSLLPRTDGLQALRLFADQAIAALRAANRAVELRHQAEHDKLTGLPNRRALEDALAAACGAAAAGSGFALLVGDLDGFKEVNDREGHAAGDAALRDVADALRGVVRADGDVAFRLGGDEFAVVVSRGDEVAVHGVARRIAAAIEAVRPGLRMSLGAALAVPGRSADPARLLADADASMYEAKRRGLTVRVVA